MSRSPRGSIVALVTHARQVPVADRQRFAAAVRSSELRRRCVLLETCHRVEAYSVAVDEAELAGSTILPRNGIMLRDAAAVRHAMAVATGRDSVVLGEDQILHQIRTSVAAARAAGAMDATTERLFASALNAGRRARSWRRGRRRSLADLALDAIERATGPVRGLPVLIVGAGRMGELAAGAAARGGARVTVADRTSGRAEAVASAIGGGTAPLDPGERVANATAVIVALGAPWSIAAGTIDAIAGGETVVVDLSVPPAVPLALGDRLAARLVGIDDLAVTDARPSVDGDAWTVRTDALIDQATDDFVSWLERRDGRAAARALAEHADREREAELAALWRRLPGLEADARLEVERMSRHLTTRLLRQPLERLGRDPDGTDGQAVRDLFAL